MVKGVSDRQLQRELLQKRKTGEITQKEFVKEAKTQNPVVDRETHIDMSFKISVSFDDAALEIKLCPAGDRDNVNAAYNSLKADIQNFLATIKSKYSFYAASTNLESMILDLPVTLISV